MRYSLFTPFFICVKLLKQFKNKLIDKSIFDLYSKVYCARHGVTFDSRKVRFIGHVKLHFSSSSTVVFGDEFVCYSGVDWGMDNTEYSKISVWDNATLSFGYKSGITNTTIHCSQSIVIGDYVNIGAGCMIFDTDYHSTYWRDREDREIDIQKGKRRPIRIGNYVFIGAKSIITKGVTIGDKSIVSAGSVVVRDIPSGEIWGGNPARFICKAEL